LRGCGGVTQGKGDDVIEFKVAFIAVEVHALLSQEPLFDAVGEGRTGANGLGVSSGTDGFRNRGLHHIRIDQIALDCLCSVNRQA
jgi:hypothetical protein